MSDADQEYVMLSIPRDSGALRIVRLRRGRESLTQLRRVVPDPKNDGELVVQALSIKDEVPLLDAVIVALVKIRRHITSVGAESKLESAPREPKTHHTSHTQRSLPLPNPESGVQPGAEPYAPDFDDSDLSNIF